MATVQLTDIYEPETFEQLIQEKSIEKNAFITSGVIVENDKLNAMAATGGRTGEMPSYNPITKDEPNYSTDNNGSTSTPDNIASATQRWRLAAMNKSWSAMDLSRELALADPVEAITNSISDYWVTAEQSRLVSSCLGILADNVANDSSDMLYTIATDDVAAIVDAERISGDAIIMASATMGDRQNEFVAIAVHGLVYAHMRKTNQIDFVEDSEANTRFAMYQDMILIVDDGLPAVAGTNRITYTSILYKASAFGMGDGRVENASELERKPDSGDGGGETVIYSRESKIIHPWGLDFTSTTVTGTFSASLANLELAVNWNRIHNRKNIGIAFLQTNG